MNQYVLRNELAKLKKIILPEETEPSDRDIRLLDICRKQDKILKKYMVAVNDLKGVLKNYGKK